MFPGQGTKEINDQLKKYKEAGTLVDFLEKKMQVFRLSADQVGQSFEAVASNATDALKVFEAVATLPLFNKIKETLGFIIKQIVDLSGDTVKLTPTFQAIADVLSLILGYVGDALFNAVQAIFGYVQDFGAYLEENKTQVAEIATNVFVIAEQVGGIALDLLSIVGDIGSANASASGWASVTQFIALTIALIRDVLNIILGTFEAIAGVLVISISTFLSYVSDTLANIIQQTGGWLNALAPVATILDRIATALGQAGQVIAERGTDRLISGLNTEKLFGAQDRINNPFKLPEIPKREGNFSFTPKRNLGGHGDGSGGRKRAEEQRIKDAQRLYNEIEKYQIANSERVLAIATESNKQLLEIEQRRFDKGLTSAEEFYRRKAEIENTDLDNQKENLRKQSEYAETALKRDLGAIAGKFTIGEDEVNGIIDKIKVLTDTPGGLEGADAKTLKQAVEYVKYLEQTAAITQKLNLIDLKRKDIVGDTGEATEKAARANKQLFDGLAAEFGTSIGQDGLSELNNLQKRVADEFPKILTETNKTLPGIKAFAKEVYDAAHVDASNLPQLLEDSGIKFDDLSEEAKLFIKLMERLQDLAKSKTVGAGVAQAQDAYRFAVEGAQQSFGNGDTTLSTAFAQVNDAKVTAIAKLNERLREQKAILADLETKKIATDQDRQAVAALQRAIDNLNKSLETELGLIDAKDQRDSAKFGAAIEAVDIQRQAGDISSKTAKQQTLDLQNQQIAALQAELNALLQLDQTNIAVQQRVAETQNKLGELRNQTNADFINFAQGVNGMIGDSFSTFLDTIQNGTATIGDAFRQLLSSLLLGIAKAIAQALLLKFILAPLGLTGGDTGGVGGFLGGLLGGGAKPPGKADGGIIAGNGTGVSDTAGVFALSHGEGVIPARRVRQYGLGFINSIISGSFLPRRITAGFADGKLPSGIGGGGGGTRIINSVDPNLVSDFLSSAAGEEIIVNIIGKNPGLVQRLV
jgi:hypothetical protein